MSLRLILIPIVYKKFRTYVCNLILLMLLCPPVTWFSIKVSEKRLQVLTSFVAAKLARLNNIHLTLLRSYKQIEPRAK